ncbi:MAG: BMC domain-containing protein [Candidatus Latescibacteria bacterium]|nr:BMC domain-containing protein [Candidatus Latescibacterota bacterium]
MDKGACGFIETKGLVGVIEAADAGVKAADVCLVSCEYATGGLVTVIFVGSVAAVIVAVEAGAAAAARVGQLIAKHVIPAPHEDLWRVLGLDPPPSNPASSAGAAVPPDIETMRVSELRRYARGIPGLDLHGRAISRATKEQLMQAIKRTQQKT